MKWLRRLVKGVRLLLAIPLWCISGFFLGLVEMFLLLARGLRLGQMGFARFGNWVAWSSWDPDHIDLKIEQRLHCRANWRNNG